MASPRLRTEDTALLLIDLQERLLGPIADRERVVNNCILMIKVAIELSIPFLVTELYPQRLGRTVETINATMIDPAARLEKTSYSACPGLLDELLTQWRRPTILVCGIEAHVCVLQTVLDLQASGRQTFVVSDAISASQTDQIAHARRRWEAAGAVTTGIMSAMYELIGDVGHPARRACVELMKTLER